MRRYVSLLGTGVSVALAVCALIAAQMALWSTVAMAHSSRENSVSCAAGSIVNVVAHEDDDILFMNPAIDQAIGQGECVRTLFLTAGDANLGSAYAAQREAGAESAYAYMAGVPDQWTATTFASNGHSLAMYTLNGAPRISLIFFRLHESADVGQTTLTTLWNGTATGPITSLNGSDSYTRADLIATLSTIFSQTAPTLVNSQDPTGVFEPGVSVQSSSVSDHPDHIAGALFVQQAWEQTSASMQLYQYRGDNIADSASDLYGNDPTRKATIFNNYYLPYDSQATDSSDYSSWFSRQYLRHQYTHTITGNFTGSGQQDVLSFYRVDDAQRTQARLFVGAGDGTLANWTTAWDSGEGGWDWNRSVVLSGDFNGDGKTDALAFYVVPNDFGHTQAYLFAGSASGLSAPTLAWDSGVGQWDWGRAQYIAGDFNGDGITDVLAFYQYNEFGHTKAWLFAGSATGLLPPVMVWDSGVGQWDWTHATYLAGDFNGDGKTDVLAFYRYDDTAHTKAWLFAGTGSSTAIQAPTMVWDSGIGAFDWNCAHFVAGDFNGDGITDAMALYQESEFGHTEALEFAGSASGITPWTVAWDSGVGAFDWTHASYVTGDFNGDGKSDVQAFYRYGDPAHTKLLFFAGTASGLANWSLAWDSGVNGWDWAYAQ